MTDPQITAFDGPLAAVDTECLLLPVFQDAEAAEPFDELDTACGGRILEALNSRAFTGKKRRCLAVPTTDGVAADEILLVGLGRPDELDVQTVRETFATAFAVARQRNASRVAIAGRTEVGTAAETAATATEALLLGEYRFTRYKPAPDDMSTIEELLVPSGGGAAEAIDRSRAIGAGVTWARDLVNTSPSDKRPPRFAENVRAVAESVGLACNVIDEDRAAELGMSALLAVGRGSTAAPRLVILEHAPEGTESTAPVCIVGKGVTFDTGGISIKPSANMDHMKSDMGGAAAVAGTMRAVAEINVQRRIVGLIPMAENMPDGDAYRPGDLVEALNGKMIEVLNTDAEGRMILADALAYGVREFEPSHVVDLATLTGACVVALGEDIAGVMANDDDLRGELVAAGEIVGERVWPLPMFDIYDDLIKSKVGDIKNTGGRWGGAITAAKFLENFVDHTPWAHLDIAGPAYRTKSGPLAPAGGVGFGVRLLVHWLSQAD